MAAGEGPDLVAVLLRQHRTGDVGDAAARFDEACGAFEHGLLLLEALGERARANAPFGVRIAPPGAGAGARRVDQNEVGAAGEIGEYVGLASWRAHLDVACVRARNALMDRCQPALVAIGRIDLAAIFHRCGERQRLAAGAGAEVEHLFARFAAGEQSGELRTFVLDFDLAFEDKPARHEWPGFLRRRRSRMRRPIGDQRVGSAPRCASFGNISSRSALSVLTRRSSGARLASAAPFAARSSPKRARKIRIEPVRIVARDMRRRVASLSALKRGPLRLRQRRRRKALAAAQRFDVGNASPRSRRNMPISTARGLASPISQADEALRRNAS